MKTALFIADAAQQSENGKHNLIGLYPDRTILLIVPATYAPGPGVEPLGLETLTCMLSVAGLGDGPHTLKGRLFDPKGAKNSETHTVTFTIANGNSHTFPFRLKPFVASAGAGTYTWKFEIDGTEVAEDFEVRFQKSAA